MSKMRILIVEDEPVIAEHISIYLDNHDFEVSGIAYDSNEAIEQLQSNTPDAAIFDVNLSSELGGIDIGRQIHERFRLPFLFLTSYSDKETIQRAKLAKPSGYIVKPSIKKRCWRPWRSPFPIMPLNIIMNCLRSAWRN